MLSLVIQISIMIQDHSQPTPSSAESQQTAESTSLASPPHSQQNTAQCAPDVSATSSPTVILVMGVAGCGKTSFVEKAIDGYQYHNVANIRSE